MNDYKFFYTGVFSQWHPSKFKIADITYNCAEQYMMYTKAILFKDASTARKILNASTPKEQKMLGRRVKNFNAQNWNAVARDVVYLGNMAKFKQNKSLLLTLLNTAPKILVEASPTDVIWGIGLTEKQAIKRDPKTWPGTNWLGLTLTKVRDDILCE